MGKICTFFGHRQAWLTKEERLLLRQTIQDLIYNQDVDTFWSGGYGQFDSDAVEIVRKFKRDLPQIKICRIIPYMPRPNQKDDMDYLNKIYDSVILPDEADIGLKRFAITRRNRYMAIMADVVVCYVKYEFGGAYTAVKTARRYKKNIINIACQGDV